jgi:hypothetical protein
MTPAPDTHYDVYSFTNAGGPACYTVYLDKSCELMAAAYVGSYDPQNLCVNHVGDLGSSALSTFSFNVLAATNFFVVVNNIPSATPGCDYTLMVFGGVCRPELKIAPAGSGKVMLDWTTAAGGYQLETTNRLVSAVAWPFVTNPPVVVNSRYQLTNATAGTNQFFRLRKP